ncbi:MAG: spore coat associated protein CotJA [Christensenellaceae bacterium]|jgi:hypothetical protein
MKRRPPADDCYHPCPPGERYSPAYPPRDGCRPPRPPKKELAQAYIPYQYYTERFAPMTALDKGTIFPELYKPYEKGGKYRSC